jgi:hypothetical protein
MICARPIAPVTRRRRLFIAVNIAPPLLRHGLMSLGRFSSVCSRRSPGWRVRGRARQLILACAIGQAVLAALASRRPIFLTLTRRVSSASS